MDVEIVVLILLGAAAAGWYLRRLRIRAQESREILTALPDALFVCDAVGRIRFANQAAARLLRDSVDDLMRKSIRDLVPLEDRERLTLPRDVELSVERTLLARDGERIDATVSFAPLRSGEDVTGAVVTARDIRDRKRAEREILQAVTLLESTLDSTADGVLVVADSGRILSYNHRFVDMWRLPEELLKRGSDAEVFEYIATQISNREAFMNGMKALAEQPEAESFDLLEFHDGRRVERYSIGRRIEGVSGVRVWSFRDVTARHAAEAALRDSEVRYRLLFEQNAAGVYVTQLDGTIIDCNATFATMLGYRRADIVGTDAGALHARPLEREELMSLLLDASILNSVEIEMKNSDGTSTWVLQNFILVGGRDGGVVHSTVVDISDRKRAEEQIEFHAFHDVLTQLPNRKLFADRLRHNLMRCRRSGRPLAVMFVDIDHFKTINDTLGHTTGDELLLELSRRLRGCVREDDTVARLGGDEFTIILSELRAAEDAIPVAQKLLDVAAEPINVGGASLSVTASIGIAIYPEDGGDAESLLRNADSAMYRAKESGRNNYQLCTEEMKQRAMERLSMETRLRRALHDGDLTVHYQPVVTLPTGVVVGAEALIRWNDPDRGLMDAPTFMQAAEETRLSLPIGEFVLKRACREAREWRDRGFGPLRVAVNLSPRQFQQHDLPEVVHTAVREARVDPGALELEITESAVMQNPDGAIETARALRRIGVGLAIDDFGVGFSSMAHLARFPITAVKIDRTFIRDLYVNGEEAGGGIVSAMIALGRSMRIRVVAEGVENESQLAFLVRRKCTEAQGYFFGRPGTAESLAATLGEHKALIRREPRLSV